MGELVRRQAEALNVLAAHPETAEILLESFRIAELQKTVPAALAAGVLELAVRMDPPLGRFVEDEARRFLETGSRREKAAGGTGPAAAATPIDDAERAYGRPPFASPACCAPTRWGPSRSRPKRGWTRRASDTRRAYAEWRALAAWATSRPPQPGAADADRLDGVASIELEAAKVARRVDGEAARRHYADGHAAEGAALVLRGRWDKAAQRLEHAAASDPAAADVRLVLARVRAHRGDLDGGAEALLEAVRLGLRPDVSWTRDPDLGRLLARDDVRAALGAR